MGGNCLTQRIRNQTLLLLQRATLGAGRQWNSLVKILKGSYFQFQLLYPAKLSIESKVAKKTFSDISCLTSTSQIFLLGIYQNKNVKKEKPGIQNTGNPLQERNKGNLQDDSEVRT